MNNPDSSPKPIRVGLMLSCLSAGGVERYHEAVCRYTRNIVWSGLTLCRGAPYYPDCVQEWLQMMPVYTNGDVSKLKRDSDVILAWAEDMRHLDDFPGITVLLGHGGGKEWFADRVNRNRQFADHFATVSREAVTKFPDDLHDQITVIEGGIDLNRIWPKPKVGPAIPWMGSKHRLGYVGRFSHEKNPMFAAELVGAMGEDYCAVYHGHNPWGEAEFISRAITAADSRIIFLNRQFHTGNVYAGLDCLIQASDAEGGPMVALEAWLTGTPLISTPVGFLEDNPDLAACSTIVPKYATLGEWVEAVQQTLNYPRPDKIEEARRIALKRFSAEASAMKWEAYIQKLVTPT